jgi:hypothetical protein
MDVLEFMIREISRVIDASGDRRIDLETGRIRSASASLRGANAHACTMAGERKLGTQSYYLPSRHSC